MQRWTGPTDLLAERGCYVCARADSLINTEVIIDQEGLLALCTGCLVTMAQHGGYRLWSPEQEAQLENFKVRARDAEHYQKIAEDAVIELVTIGEGINERRAARAAEVEAHIGGRDSAGRFRSKVLHDEAVASTSLDGETQSVG